MGGRGAPLVVACGRSSAGHCDNKQMRMATVFGKQARTRARQVRWGVTVSAGRPDRPVKICRRKVCPQWRAPVTTHKYRWKSENTSRVMSETRCGRAPTVAGRERARWERQTEKLASGATKVGNTAAMRPPRGAEAHSYAYRGGNVALTRQSQPMRTPPLSKEYHSLHTGGRLGAIGAQRDALAVKHH